MKDDRSALTVAVQDIDAIEKMMTHFNFPRNKEYIQAVEIFRKDPTNIPAMKELIYEVAKSMGSCKGKNELVDEVFAEILPACNKISYELAFDKDLEEVIGKDVSNPEKA